MRKPPTVADALAAMSRAKAGGRGRKSQVHLWLRQNHDEIEAAFKLNAPSWPAMAEYLGKAGLKGGDGNLPTAAGVRSTWARVVDEVAKCRAASGAPPVADTTGSNDESADDAKFPFVRAK
jgi:hypothetical protein